MPELPEVETFRRYIERTSLRRPVVKMEVRNDVVVRGADLRALTRAVEGSEFLSVRRHGKRLFLELSGGGWLTWHFGMTGRPVWTDGVEERFARVLFVFPQGSLAFVDPRMLGRLGLTPSPERFIEERGLGPDALEITSAAFVGTFRDARGPIKAALMDQRKVAGVGNLYADEILFQCQLDPRAEARSLSDGDLECLHRAMRRVLRRSIEVGTDFDRLPRSYLLRVRGRGARCPRCGSALRTETVGGRTTYFCPHCL
jgi:formamidopyrimidine-DNA glycosylase